MMKEFEILAKQRVSKEQRDAMPLLRLEEDKQELTMLRSINGSDNDNYAEREKLERRVLKETEYRDRFMARLRKARRKTYDIEKDEAEQDTLTKEELAVQDGTAENTDDTADENNEETKKESTT